MKCQNKYNVMGFQSLVCISSQKSQQKSISSILPRRDTRKILVPWAASVREEAEGVTRVSVKFNTRSHHGSPSANKASHQNTPTISAP